MIKLVYRLAQIINNSGLAMQENIVATVLYFSSSMVFLLLYTFVFHYIATHAKERRQTFYKMLMQLSVSDCLMLIVNAFYAAPSTLFGCQIFGETAGY